MLWFLRGSFSESELPLSYNAKVQNARGYADGINWLRDQPFEQGMIINMWHVVCYDFWGITWVCRGNSFGLYIRFIFIAEGNGKRQEHVHPSVACGGKVDVQSHEERRKPRVLPSPCRAAHVREAMPATSIVTLVNSFWYKYVLCSLMCICHNSDELRRTASWP